eukprot:gnl/TRDRNA2_/TRDRNA2_135441_c1_seq1.p1 gnl/TRDRNA2_/TRDRNA2_135441_c1~~gnl/TRDRNA2_/TRDRNA2_135441_c1_seq1.p1  ORF type:complete len:253 (-),score=17.78 gnl/TRDRNA2_/TRDRNA2_135441_c1_seq1:127-885(-)
MLFQPSSNASSSENGTPYASNSSSSSRITGTLLNNRSVDVRNGCLHVEGRQPEAVGFHLSRSSSDSIINTTPSKSSSASSPCNRQQRVELPIPPHIRSTACGAASSRLQSDGQPASSSHQLESDASRPPFRTSLADPGYATVGSANHEIGKCKPCLWFISEIGCSHGVSCVNCHFQHFGRAKPSKAKRDSVRRRAAAQAEKIRAAEAAAAAQAADPAKSTGEVPLSTPQRPSDWLQEGTSQLVKDKSQLISL